MDINLNTLSDQQLLDLAKAFSHIESEKKYNKQQFIFNSYRDNPEGYRRHLEFIKATKYYNEIAMIAGNRVGKTYTAEMCISFHANGKYPAEWQGKRFDIGGLEILVVGKTHDTTRDILQKYLYGNFLDPGTGMIPKEDIIRRTIKSGLADAIQDLYVQHYDSLGNKDGVTKISFKSYVQGIEAFMGQQYHVVHLDEEPLSREMYSEILTRTMTTKGIVMSTFTPLEGMSDVVMSFLPNGKFPMGGYGPVVEDV